MEFFPWCSVKGEKGPGAKGSPLIPQGEKMELSILIARIASVIYLSAALGGFFSTDYYRRIVDDLFANAALAYMTGFTAVILGALIAFYHNVWTTDWRVLITIIGWIAIIKGVAIIAFPGFIRRISVPFVTGTGLKLFPFAALLLGLLFGWFGFVA